MLAAASDRNAIVTSVVARDGAALDRHRLTRLYRMIWKRCIGFAT
jgi:hypothetical protein